MMSRKEEVTFLLKRHSESIKSRGYNFIEVARDNVFEDLISTYKKRGVSNKEIKIVFSGEDAVGTGLRVMRSRFFFKQEYNIFEGNNEKIPPVDMDCKTLEIIGKINTHSYILYKTFPHKLSISALKNQSLKRLDPEELLKSNLNYLSRNEAEVQHTIDILNESRVLAVPTSVVDPFLDQYQ